SNVFLSYGPYQFAFCMPADCSRHGNPEAPQEKPGCRAAYPPPLDGLTTPRNLTDQLQCIGRCADRPARDACSHRALLRCLRPADYRNVKAECWARSGAACRLPGLPPAHPFFSQPILRSEKMRRLGFRMTIGRTAVGMARNSPARLWFAPKQFP